MLVVRLVNSAGATPEQTWKSFLWLVWGGLPTASNSILNTNSSAQSGGAGRVVQPQLLNTFVNHFSQSTVPVGRRSMSIVNFSWRNKTEWVQLWIAIYCVKCFCCSITRYTSLLGSSFSQIPAKHDWGQFCQINAQRREMVKPINGRCGCKIFSAI